MALITCPECGKENVSDSAAACPACGFSIKDTYSSTESQADSTTSSEPVVTDSTKAKKSSKKKLFVFLLILVLLALLIAPVATEDIKESQASRYYNHYNYREALPLLQDLCSRDGAGNIIVDYKKTAASALGLVNYDDCRKVLTDCSFLYDLEESVLARMEAPDDTPYLTLCTSDLAFLDKYRKANFYSSAIAESAEYYLSGVDLQLSGLDYEFLYQQQFAWDAGMVIRCEVLNFLYSDFNFMSGNAEFVGTYINNLSFRTEQLEAMDELISNGSERTEEPKIKSDYVEYYFKNNTPYTSSRVYDLRFYKDEEGKQHCDTVYVSIDNVGPYEEFTIRADVPDTVPDDFWVWTNGCYFEEIIIE